MTGLIRNTIFNVLYRITSLVFPLIYSAYVARIIFADGVGRVEYANNIISYFIMIAVFGLPTYGTREIAKRKLNQADKNKLFTELFVVNFLCTSFSLVLFVCLLLFNGRINADYQLFLCFELLDMTYFHLKKLFCFLYLYYHYYTNLSIEAGV